MKADVDKRKEIHQKLMNKTDSIQPGRQENEYCEPTFTKDVQREVLDELGIQYFVYKQELLETISYMELLFKHSRQFVDSLYRSHHTIHPTKIDTTNKEWFETAVARGLIAIPYINLKNNSSFSGSWLIVNNNRDDAILVALDLIFYALGLLTYSTDLKISFIGCQFSSSIIWDIEKKLPSHRALYMFRSNSDLYSAELLRVIIHELMNGFDFVTLDSISKDCHMIIIALVNYSRKNKDFQIGVYSILLSYLMLGPIGNQVGVLKKSNFAVTHNTGDKTKDRYVTVANAFIDLFYVNESRLKTIFNRKILHNVSEFEHCLQHVNFLNKLCGEVTMCTIYHKAVNATFVHNLYFTLTQEKNPLEYLKRRINCDSIYL
ncbi:uncharacterized protein LOC123713558 isoform X2 [Pieris brassicae]|nr:uncharacterized protein LOC123713558 isoform X2 [Pieris brassicae]XP_045523241.1 uncharacterized protein LOC123713558 isoform X2 [Pieris brassicae]